MILVTGLMRSGSSATAQMLSQMGVVMGTTMDVPPCSPFHAEWEDRAFQEPMLAGCLSLDPVDTGAIREYIASRRRHLEEMRNKFLVFSDWGVKTPFALPFLGEIREACESMGEPLRVILMDRPLAEAMESLHRVSWAVIETERDGVMSMMFSLQHKLADALEKERDRADTVLDSKLVWSYPKCIAERLSNEIGLGADLDAAVRGIWR